MCPIRLGYLWLTEGTARSYPHSLLTTAVTGAWFALRRRDVLLGAAFGIAVYFFKDLAEVGSGVSLLWPISHRSRLLAASTSAQ